MPGYADPIPGDGEGKFLIFNAQVSYLMHQDSV